MTTVLLSPIWVATQFFDDSGTPLSNGQIVTYAAGSFTTQLETYTTAAGDVQNSNPIILDSEGRINTAIWLIDGAAYQFVLYAANGVTVLASCDDITGQLSPTTGAVTINGTSIALGTSGTVTAAASTLTGTTLASGVTASSLTSVGTLTSLAVTGTNTTNGITVGYLEVPQNSQSTAYTLVLADSGKHILHPSADTTARTFVIPANSSVAYPIGTVITFVNQNSAGILTIAITTDTMRLAGAGTTGSRTLAANGIATALKITATEWIISGTGIL